MFMIIYFVGDANNAPKVKGLANCVAREYQGLSLRF